MIAKSNVAAKFASVVAGLGLVAMAIAPAAQADTTSDLQAQIASLLAQISSLQAQLGTSTTTGTSMMFTTDLTLGSSGASVTALQNWLISKGFSISAGATGFFGAQTKAALAAYQAANGISPAAGYFGPVTRAKVNASGGTTTGGTTTGGTTSTGPLSGGEGSIDNFKTIGATNTTLGQGDSDQVLGFEFKADGSDLQVNRVDFDIVNSNNVGSVRPWGVFQTATLMNGSATVGTVDLTNANNFSEDGTGANGNQQYRIRFDNLKDVVKNGNTVDYTLTLSTQNSISVSNTGANYTVTLPNQGVRAVDAMGIQQYSSSSIVATVNTSNSTAGSVVLSTGSDNPQTTTVQGDSNNSTTGITLNTFTLQAKDAAATLYSLPVLVATTTSNASNQIRSLKLYQGSTLLDTESIAAGGASVGTTTFQNLNLTIPAGTTDSFKVVADINKIDNTGNFNEGASVTVTVPGNGIDIENGSNRVTVQGTATGNPITFRSLGLAADSAPTTTAVVANNGGNVTSQTGTFTFTFNVTAFGQDAFIASTTNAYGVTVFDFTNSNTATSSNVTGSVIANPNVATSLTSTADRSTLGNYVIHSGQTKQITIQVALSTAGAGHFYYAVLKNLKFNTSDASAGISGDQTITLPTAYQSGQAKINS